MSHLSSHHTGTVLTLVEKQALAVLRFPKEQGRRITLSTGQTLGQGLLQHFFGVTMGSREKNYVRAPCPWGLRGQSRRDTLINRKQTMVYHGPPLLPKCSTATWSLALG